jgi:integrase
VLSTEDIKRLLQAVQGHVLEMPVFLAVYTGMRLGEVLALKWSDIVITNDEGIIYVQRELLPGKAASLEFGALKTKNSHRSIPVGAHVVERLRYHAERQQVWRMIAGSAWQDASLVCTRENGSHILLHTASVRFSKIARRLGLAISFHDLRHAHATHLLAAGVPPKAVAERLGHTKVGFLLDTYAHVLPTLQKNVVKVLDTLFGTS